MQSSLGRAGGGESAPAFIRGEQRFKRYRLLLVVLPIVAAIVCIGIGRYYVSPADAVSAIWQFVTGVPTEVGATEYSVVVNLRLPRVLLALLSGAALAASGTAFQSVFSNPLAAPDTLGVSAGAGFGACLGLLLGLPTFPVQMMAFFMGLLAVILTFWVSRGRRAGAIALVLAGIAIAALFQSGTAMTQLLADPNQTLPEITYWLLGSLSRANYDSLKWAVPVVFLGLGVLYVLRWRLNMLSLDDQEATTLGVPVKVLRRIVVLAATLCTASSVALCGMVGWLGILAPHMARMLFGADTRMVLPAAISIGAVSLVIVDTLARNLMSGVLPISVVTAIIGAPVFIVLLRRTLQ